MSGNVVSIHGQPVDAGNSVEPDPELVDMAKQILRDAESGNLRALAMTGITQDGSVATAITVGNRMFPLLGGVSHLQNRLLKMLDR